MMKKKRCIAIKDPKLRRIRDNLREILIKTFQIKDIKLTSEIDAILRDSEGKPRMDITPSESAKLKRFKDMKSKINELTDKSICYCNGCKQINKDMTYNPTLESWYCVECSEEFRNHYYQQEIRKQKGDFWVITTNSFLNLLHKFFS